MNPAKIPVVAPRIQSNALRLRRLGRKYRKETPPQKRSYRAWLEFLAAHAPKFIGHAGVEGGVQIFEASKGAM